MSFIAKFHDADGVLVASEALPFGEPPATLVRSVAHSVTFRACGWESGTAYRYEAAGLSKRTEPADTALVLDHEPHTPSPGQDSGQQVGA